MSIGNNSVIILNGTSSSGKTSIANEIVNQIEEPIIHAQIDMFHGMFDFSKFKTGAKAFEASQIAFSLFDRSVENMCEQEFPIVIDTVFERLEYYLPIRLMHVDRLLTQFCALHTLYRPLTHTYT